jgi:hypothetical protein
MRLLNLPTMTLLALRTALSTTPTSALLAQRSVVTAATKRPFSSLASATKPQPPNNYWNREESTPLSYSTETAAKTASSTATATAAVVTRSARILSLSSADDPANVPLHQGDLPEGANLLAIGTKLEEFDVETLKLQKPNVIFVSHPLVRTTIRSTAQ